MLQPTRNLVSISPKFESDKYETKSGIEILKHDSYKRRTTQGIVKLVGPDCREDVCVGDYVFYSAYDGSLWYDKGEILIIMPDDKVLGRLINIPDTAINGLFVRERINKEKNYHQLSIYLLQYAEENGVDFRDIAAFNFIQYISEKVDSYGAYFECPMDKAVELIASTLKEAPWARGIEVGGTQQSITDLYKETTRVCEYCGGHMRMMEDRTATTIFYRCQSCGKIKDRKMIRDSK